MSKSTLLVEWPQYQLQTGEDPVSISSFSESRRSRPIEPFVCCSYVYLHLASQETLTSRITI